MNKLILILLIPLLCGTVTGDTDVAAGASIQTAINASGNGDTITLTDSDTYTADTFLVFDGSETTESITIIGQGAANTIIQCSDSARAIHFEDAYVTGTITFQDVTIVDTSATSTALIRIDGTGAKVCVFEDCIIGDGTAGQIGIKTVGSDSAVITLTRTPVITTDLILFAGAGDTLGNITFTGQTLTSNYNAGMIGGTGTIGTLTLDTVAFVNTATSFSAARYCVENDFAGMGDVIIKDCTFDTTGMGGISIDEYAGTVLVQGCRVSITSSSANTGKCYEFGKDATTNANPLGAVRAYNNTGEYLGSNVNHCMLVGAGCDNSVIWGNTLKGGDYQLVVKGDGNYIYGNICDGANTLYFKGGSRPIACNNTFVANSGYAIRQFTDGAAESDRPVVFNNIFVASGSGVMCYKNTHNDPFDSYFDYNCYWAENSATISDLGGTITTLAGLQAQWQTYDFIFADLNDINSLNVNPHLDSGYRPKNIQLTQGKPDTNGSPTSIGSTAPPLPAKGSYGLRQSTYGGNP